MKKKKSFYSSNNRLISFILCIILWIDTPPQVAQLAQDFLEHLRFHAFIRISIRCYLDFTNVNTVTIALSRVNNVGGRN